MRRHVHGFLSKGNEVTLFIDVHSLMNVMFMGVHSLLNVNDSAVIGHAHSIGWDDALRCLSIEVHKCVTDSAMVGHVHHCQSLGKEVGLYLDIPCYETSVTYFLSFT